MGDSSWCGLGVVENKKWSSFLQKKMLKSPKQVASMSWFSKPVADDDEEGRQRQDGGIPVEDKGWTFKIVKCA